MHRLSILSSMDFTELGKISAEWSEFVQNATPLGYSKLVPGMDPKAARALVESSRARLSDADLSANGLNVRTLTWTDPTTTQQLQFRLFTPPEATANPSQVFPLYLYFHGGGFLLGSIDSDVAECARISTSSGMLVLSANYRHTDTHPFPAQHDDAWSALQFALSSSPELTQVDHTRILVAGASAGANLALVTALRAGAENIPLAGLVLQSPWLADPALFPDSSSASQHAAGPVVTAADLAWYVALLAAGTAASPLLAADEDLLKLPRTYVQVCGMDPLRDDGLVFCARLKEMGIEVGLDVYPGLPHAFNNIQDELLPASGRFWRDCEKGVRWLLGDHRESVGVEKWIGTSKGINQ